MPGAEPAPAGITLNQAMAIVRELGFTLRHEVDRAEYRLRPVGAADPGGVGPIAGRTRPAP